MNAYIVAGGLPDLYRCESSNLTEEEWWELGKKEPVIGAIFIAYGVVSLFFYYLCVTVLLDKDLFSTVAYKILFFLSCSDMFGMFTNSFVSGILFLQGAVYCNYPQFLYIWGSLTMAWWGGICCGGFMLGLTRLVDLLNPRLHDQLFAGYKISIIFLIIFAYLLYFLFFAPPVLFNSLARSWIFDPLIQPNGSNVLLYTHWAVPVNNMGTVSLTFLLYVIFGLYFICKYKNVTNISRNTYQMMLQAIIISLNTSLLAFIYVLMSYVHVTESISFVALILWQMTASGGLFALMGINHTVRGRVFKKIGLSGKLIKGSQVTEIQSSRVVGTRRSHSGDTHHNYVL